MAPAFWGRHGRRHRPRADGIPSRVRRIEDNIATTSLLPHVLLADNVTGAIVFLDISKAYDTVDRAFLFRVMEIMGA